MFRKELIGEGFNSDTIQRHQQAIKDYLRFLCDNRLLEEENPASKRKKNSGCGPSDRKSSVKPVAKAQDWVAHTPLGSIKDTLISPKHHSQKSNSTTAIGIAAPVSSQSGFSNPETYYMEYRNELSTLSHSS